jgi:hypothetical protein
LSAKRVVPVVIITGLAIGVCIVGLLAIGGLELWKAAGNCPPSDFPRYAGSAQTSFNVNVGSVTECDAEFSAPAGVVTVTDYMRTSSTRATGTSSVPMTRRAS